ncbi:MAG: hypothetical protein IKL86_04905 [Clostridia bacterium]|nr:hypothetical protein [Clostridia bacterium]
MMNMLLAFENLNPMNLEVLKASLNILWQGLLAIFIVIGLIIVAVTVTTDIIAWSKRYKDSHPDFSIKNIFKKK